MFETLESAPPDATHWSTRELAKRHGVNRRSVSVSMAEQERLVLDADGVVIRYGQPYGPGTYCPDDLPAPPRIHGDNAAQRTWRIS